MLLEGWKPMSLGPDHSTFVTSPYDWDSSDGSSPWGLRFDAIFPRYLAYDRD